MESLSLKGRRSSNASQGAPGEEPEGNANDTSQLDKEEGNVLMTIIGQRASTYPLLLVCRVDGEGCGAGD